MSEKFTGSKQENLNQPEYTKERSADHEAQDPKERKGWLKRANELDEARKDIESLPADGIEHKTKEDDKSPDKPTRHERPARVSKELKDLTYRRTMKRVQKKLPRPARTFSKFIHNPSVEVISELGAKTIARPSGILLGGIFAFIGSSIFLWITKRYGYEYNYLLFALFFIGGYFAGLLVELGLRQSSRKR